MGEVTNGLLKFITCGSVDDGKSTLIGNILYSSKLLYTDQEQALLLDSRVGSRGGEIDYSLLLDGLMAEREQGITIDVAYRYFTTDARSFIVADTPGHEEYTRNMAVGASFADLAVILVDATLGVLVQTRRHARICALMGIRHFAFAVNKMDLVDFEQSTFENIEIDIKVLSDELALEHVVVIPLSATEGDNVTKPSIQTNWYKGQTLLSFLETVDITASTGEIGWYMPVQRVCRPNHTFRGFQGQIEAGHISVGEEITALPSREAALIKSVHVADKSVQTAMVGQPVTIQLDREVDVSRGCVLTKQTDLNVGKSFSASLLWMDDTPLIPGNEYWVKIGTKLIPAVVAVIQHKVNVNNGETRPAATLGKNELGLCVITLSQPVVFQRFSECKAMGELILINRISHATSACGIISQIDTQNIGGVAFEAGENLALVRIFDAFYYHPDAHTVVRHCPESTVYHIGDVLPLEMPGYHYPPDFDVMNEDAVLRVRGGKFAGFGARDKRFPLLDDRGLQAGSRLVNPFSEDHPVAVWADADET